MDRSTFIVDRRGRRSRGLFGVGDRACHFASRRRDAVAFAIREPRIDPGSCDKPERFAGRLGNAKRNSDGERNSIGERNSVA